LKRRVNKAGGKTTRKGRGNLKKGDKRKKVVAREGKIILVKTKKTNLRLR